MQPEVPTGPRGTEIVLPSVAEAGNDARVATWRSLGRRLRGRIRTAALRMRRRWRSAVFRAARLAGASVAAFLAAEGFGLVDPPPLVAALTALLVVQATASSTLFSGVERVLSVVAGVALAMGFVSVVGLTWWSLGILVAASIIVGQLLRLGPNLIEVPISAMLVLGVGYTSGAEATGMSRVVETLIGAAVGVLVNVLFPPAVRSRYAGQAVQRLADEIAALLEEATEGLTAVAAPAPGQVRATDSGNFFPTGTGWFTHPLGRPDVRRPRADRRRDRPLAGRRPPAQPARAAGRPGADPRRGEQADERPRAGQPGERAEPARRPGGPRAVLGGRAQPVPLDRRLGPQRHDRAGLRPTPPGPAPRGPSCSPTSPSWSARSAHCCGPRSRAGRRPRRPPCPTRWTGSGSTGSAHAEALLADPREHPDLWELDGALVALVDRMLLELDTAAHAKLWEDHRRDVVDRHRATELFERLRSRRRSERAAGTEPAPEGAPPEERPSRARSRRGGRSRRRRTRRRDGAAGLRSRLLAQREAPI